MYSQDGTLLFKHKDGFDTNYIYLGKKLIARSEDAFAPQTAGSSRQHNLPFGETVETPKNDVGYTGHQFDTDLGLSYMQQRYYDPAAGVFYSPDPVGFRDVYSFNRYVYANNNPYKYTDPNGEFAVLALFIPEIVALGNAAFFVGSAAIAGYAGSEAINAYNENSNESNSSTSTASEGNEKPRFIADSEGVVVDTEATPKGSYQQPDGGRTDVLQNEDHGAGRSHTHNPITNTNPVTGEVFVNGVGAGEPVTANDVENITSGAATSVQKGR